MEKPCGRLLRSRWMMVILFHSIIIELLTIYSLQKRRLGVFFEVHFFQTLQHYIGKDQIAWESQMATNFGRRTP